MFSLLSDHKVYISQEIWAINVIIYTVYTDERTLHTLL